MKASGDGDCGYRHLYVHTRLGEELKAYEGKWWRVWSCIAISHSLTHPTKVIRILG